MTDGIVSASDQRLDYLKLLVTELQNQNPLEPLDNQQMAAQLAQFSQLELTEEMNGNLSQINSTMESLNSSFQGAMLVQELEYAKTLLGKEVTFYSDYYGHYLSGDVKKVTIVDGAPELEVHVNMTNPDQSIETRAFSVKLEQVEQISE